MSKSSFDYFVENNQVEMHTQRVASRPDGSDMDGDHWKCLIHSGHRRYTVYFTCGYGHNGKDPDLKTVLECLQSDARAGNQSFEYFCGDFGYDTDSRRAEATWKACRKTHKELTRLFGIQVDTFLSLDFNEENE